jgi:hypothetical protein
MPEIKFEEDAISIELPGGHSFFTEFNEDEDVTVELTQYSDGTYQGHLQSTRLHVTFDPDDKILSFAAADTSFNVALTDYQVIKLRQYFIHGDYYPTEFPEERPEYQNTDPSNPNGNDPNTLSQNENQTGPQTITEEVPMSGGKRKQTRRSRSRRQKLKASRKQRGKRVRT